ncbi:MAG: amino acid ABC transporter substrate-binding protein [Actinobacteria bacterium]|nr:amino acid ABC transporter substrate-binding protein [Actinomycetota bacterium]
MKRHSTRFLPITAAGAAAVTILAACSSGGGGGGSSSSTPTNHKPITIGVSVSLTGDFSADGQAFQRGYNLWASDVNKAGGIAGRKVKFIYLDDKSDPTQGSTNVQQLISSDHVDMLFGPFSSLITGPTATVAARYGYAMIEGAGGAPAVFDTPSNKARHNVFDVSYPIVDQYDPLTNWVKSMPAGQRPATAAYPIVNNPFTIPPEQRAQGQLEAAGVKTVYSKVLPAELPNATSDANQVAASGAQAVFLGSVDVPTVAAFMKAFQQQHYNPKILAATAGPDQGAAFIKAVGKANATGVMTANGWYGGYDNPQSKKMVQEYIAKYGGTPSDINSDVAEGYGVGQVAAQAIRATGGTDQAKIIQYLHSGVTLQSVQGPVQFNSLGMNTKPVIFVFQWQNGNYAQVLPANAPGSGQVLFPKPAWAG